MNIENRLEYLEQKIDSLESTIQELKDGNFEQISVNKILIKQKENESSYYDENLDDTGIFIYDKNGSLLYKTFITKRNCVRTVFYGRHNDEVVEFGLCEHGGGRLKLNNTNGEDMIYLGSTNDNNDHSARLQLHSQDQSGRISLFTSNLEKDDKLFTNIQMEQKDENNDENNFIYIGVNNNNESGLSLGKVLMITNQEGKESVWEKNSTDKF